MNMFKTEQFMQPKLISVHLRRSYGASIVHTIYQQTARLQIIAIVRYVSSLREYTYCT
jgi:hypothetical protein